MKLYKLKHLPTGLFFTPSKSAGNLSLTGKIYDNLSPKRSWIETIRIQIPYCSKLSKKNKIICDYFEIEHSPDRRIDEYFKTNPRDWEIIELKND